MKWFTNAITNNYVNFNGRARREEYWMFTLFSFIFSFVFGFIDGLLGITILTTLYTLAIFLPSLAVLVRRLHDIDKSAWWILIAFVPFVGTIVLLVFAVLPGTVGDNRYGADPKSGSSF